MKKLVTRATELLEERYRKPVHTVAAALETKEGKVFLGLNIDHFSGFVCAEMSVLATAMNAGEKDFLRIAAVRKNQDGTIVVVNPCGKCRQILYDYTPSIQVAVIEGEAIKACAIEELLPYSFKRQREKIQLALNGGEIEEVIG